MNGIGFSNFKVFSDKQWFDFKPLTVLTGSNNSGKSSLIHGMKLLQENLDLKGIDNLLKKRFSSKNPTRQGTIKNFIHAEGGRQGDCFTFFRKIEKLEYSIELKVEDSLEDYASIKSVKVIDSKNHTEVFYLNVLGVPSNPRFDFRLNLRYFIDELHDKIKNTRKFHEGMIELDLLLSKVNKGEVELNVAEDFAFKLSKEVGIYIYIGIFYPPDSVGDEDKGRYTSHATDDPDLWEIPKFLDQITVVMDDGGFSSDKRIRTLPGVASLDFIADIYGEFLLEKYISFDFIWRLCPEWQLKFEKAILAYYDEVDLSLAYRKLNSDIFAHLSLLSWRVDFDSGSPFLYGNDTPEGHNIFKDIVSINSSNGFMSLLRSGGFAFDSPRYYSKREFGPYQIVSEFDTSLESHKFNAEFKHREFVDLWNMLAEIYRSILNSEDTMYERERIAYVNDNILLAGLRNHMNNCIKDILLDVDLSLDNVFVSSVRGAQNRLVPVNELSDFNHQIQNFTSMAGGHAAKVFVNKWLVEFGIADELILESDSSLGGYKAFLKRGRDKFLVQDFGLGTNQIVPIIISLAVYRLGDGYNSEFESKTVVIEEPEANLHPALQSKLADMFAEAIKKFKIQIIVETHSEYLIRKLQYLVATNSSDIMPSDVLIYYFNQSFQSQGQNGVFQKVDVIRIDQFGRLSQEFGSGFFDEADRIAMELFMLSHSQSN
jgi:AAA15 family ATPase/GTPase